MRISGHDWIASKRVGAKVNFKSLIQIIGSKSTLQPKYSSYDLAKTRLTAGIAHLAK